MRNNIKTVACVGAGLIGQGWATLFAANGYDVIMQDLSEDRLENATAQVNLNLKFLENNGRLHKGQALLRLEGCHDRTAAEALRGYLVQIPSEEALPLEEGEYYEHQILGLAVWTASGEYLGELVEIIYTGANDVYVVQPADANGKDILLPALEDVVLDIDADAGRLVVELPEGLL